MAGVLSRDEATTLETPELKISDGHSTLQSWALKRRIRYAGLLPCFPPVWNNRYLVLRGKFLFRFAEDGENEVKGSPIPVDVVNIEIVDEAFDDDGEILPYCFKLSSIRKTYFFAVQTKEERDQWVVKLKKEKEGAIKQSLGHAAVESWERQSNDVGRKLYDQSVNREKADTDLTSSGGVVLY
mmetsp:Transcript_17656/g.21449  ORF Transcript_17656/g.21449 Transcript_17656/m.21449 type:complete len:183 (-) Transcript_17656:119-667(-)